MQASPIQIDAYFLKDLEFTITDSLESDSFEGKEFEGKEFEGLEISISDKTIAVKNISGKWRSEVIVEAKGKKGKAAPYTFKVIMVGFFTLSSDYPEDRAKLLVETNAPAILYSSIREIVFNMTSRNPFPTLLLPSVTFLRPEGNTKQKGKKTERKKPKKT